MMWKCSIESDVVFCSGNEASEIFRVLYINV